MDDLAALLSSASLDRLGAVTTLIVIAILVIRGKLVWHTVLDQERERANRWEQTALDLLTSARAGVTAAETTAAIVSNIPDPQGERDRARSEGVNGA